MKSDANIESEVSIFEEEEETTGNIILKAKINDMEFYAEDDHYLPAYQKLRDELLKMHYGIKCNGSRLNAVQSGMMGNNDKIYLVQLGQKALNKDIVSLYGDAEISEFPDTEEQNQFLEKWIVSIKG